MKRTNELGKGRRVSAGPDGSPGGPKPSRHGTFGRASDLRRKRGCWGREQIARGAVWDTMWATWGGTEASLGQTVATREVWTPELPKEEA